MALPTTNLTAHFDASNNDDVIKTGSTSAVDGENVEEWEDDDGKDLSLWYTATSGQGATYRTASPLMKAACLDFDPAATEHYGLYNSAGSVAKAGSAVVSASAFTILVSLYIEAILANNAAAVDNDPVLGGEDFGIFLKDSTPKKVQFFNWDGNEDTISLDVSVNTSYVLMFRHEGGNIYGSINGGAETSLASGNTTQLTDPFFVGRLYGGTRYFNGRIGEIATYNVALTGTNLTDAISWFTGRWLAATQLPKSRIVNQAAHRAAYW